MTRGIPFVRQMQTAPDESASLSPAAEAGIRG